MNDRTKILVYATISFLAFVFVIWVLIQHWFTPLQNFNFWLFTFLFVFAKWFEGRV